MLASRKLFCCLLSAIAALLLAPVSAGAAENYGAWFPSPDQTTGVYDPSITPFNDENVAEQTSFACVAPNGQVISEGANETLATIVLAASDVFNGSFSFGETAELPTGGEKGNQRPPKNGGYPSGRVGMQAFIRNELQLLRSGRWVDYSARTLQRGVTANKHTYLTSRPGWAVGLDQGSKPLSRQRGAEVAALLPATAAHPLELTSELPEACALSPLLPDEPSFGKLFSSPGGFVTDVFLFAPAELASAGYDFIQPFAFRYTFFTPHTERGDLMWEIPSNCSPRSPENKAFSAQEVSAACSGGTPLGYSRNKISSSADRPWFLDAAVFLQWLISGTYFLILFTAAVLFIFRGNRATQLNVMHLVPRLVLSIVLTMMAGYLIGAAVTASNLVVQTIFDFHDVRAVGAINTFLLQAGNIVGGPTLLQQVTQLVVGITTTFFLLVFVLASLVRQVVLVGLIILAPLAAFSLLSPRWQGHFRLYVRTLAAVILLPVILAFILKVGMSINPLLTDPGAAYGQLAGAAGLALMVVTLWLMYKAIKMTKDFAIHGGVSLSELWGDRLALAGGGPGGGALGSRSLPPLPDPSGQDREKPRASIVPQTKQIGGGVGDAPAIVSRRVPTSGGEPPGIRGLISNGAQSTKSEAEKSFTTFQEKRRELGKRIQPGAAKRYREGLRRAIGAATASKGRKLTPEEVEAIKADYARKNGGRLVEQNGAWYLMPTEPKGFEGADGGGPDRAQLEQGLRSATGSLPE